MFSPLIGESLLKTLSFQSLSQDLVSLALQVLSLLSPFVPTHARLGEWMGGSDKDYCSIYADRRFSISLSLLVVFPLSCLKHLDSLRYTSYLVRTRQRNIFFFDNPHFPNTSRFLFFTSFFIYARCPPLPQAIVMVLYLLIMVVVLSGKSIKQGTKERVNFGNISESIFRAVPIVTLAYTCQVSRSRKEFRSSEKFLSPINFFFFWCPCLDELLFTHGHAGAAYPPTCPSRHRWYQDNRVHMR